VVKRTVSGAHYGIMGWLVQRVTAAFMAAFILVFLVILMLHLPASYASWKTLISREWMRIGLLLFFFALFLHAWIGMRDILMDYVHPPGIRLLLFVLIILSLLAYAIWAVRILWGN
jgi:succinate dehydrogenase / fumarate reductase membrane anchor subunit